MNPHDFQMKSIVAVNKQHEIAFSKLKQFKLQSSPEDICKDPRSQCLIPLCKEAYSYAFEEEPQYGVLIYLLEREIIKLQGIPDRSYSWMLPRGYHAQNIVRDDRQISPEPPEAADEYCEGPVEINIVKQNQFQDGDRLRVAKDSQYWRIKKEE